MWFWKKFYYLLICLPVLLCIINPAYSEETKNHEIFPDNTGRGLDIFYDLLDDDTNAFFEVKIRITENDGVTYIVPETVSGDIGIGVFQGKRKRIHWDTLKDIDDLISFEAKVEIETRRLGADEIGSISIKVLPPDADVFINGINIGKTPIQSKELPIGEHTLIISYDKYDEYVKKINIEGRKSLEIIDSLTPKFGFVTIEGFPEGAEVFFDDEKVGEAPIVNKQENIGNYSVKIISKGYADYDSTLRVTIGENTGFSFELIPLRHGYISISGFPKGAEIFLNRRTLGEAPITNKEENIGDHNVRISSKWYNDFESTLHVESGELSEFNYKLIPKTPKEVITKSLVIPGNGQRYAEFHKKGNIITFLQVITLAGAVITSLSASNATSTYNEAISAYKKAHHEDEINLYRSDMQDGYNDVKSASNLQTAAFAAFLGIYTWNIVDAVLTSKKIEFDSPESSIGIEPLINKEYTAVLLSIRF